MSPIKELHYFDALWIPNQMAKRTKQHLNVLKRLTAKLTLDDIERRGKRWQGIGQYYDRLEMGPGGHEKYLEFFAKRVGDCPVAAEISPSYSLLSADNFREIRAIHPRVKVIFLMRNPIDRQWSALRYQVRKRVDFEELFDRALQSESMMMSWSDYAHTLEALTQAFTPEQVFIELYENLFTEAAIRRLCSFLDILYRPAPFETVVNKAVEMPLSIDRRRQMAELLRPVYEYCHGRFGERLPAPWLADLELITRDR